MGIEESHYQKCHMLVCELIPKHIKIRGEKRSNRAGKLVQLGETVSVAS